MGNFLRLAQLHEAQGGGIHAIPQPRFSCQATLDHCGPKCYNSSVAATAPSTFCVFASKPFMRFARRFEIDAEVLWETVKGPCDADLGGGDFKYRPARQGEGSSGGARALIAMKAGQRAVLMFGFEKKDMANIRPDELRGYRKAEGIYLHLSEEQVTEIVKQKALIEIAR